MMYLKIPVINRKYLPLKVSLRDKTVHEKTQEEFAYYLAKEMRLYLKQAIKLQKYKIHWKPLSVKYLEYKRRKGLSLNIWEATSLLVDSISVRKYGNYYIIGFPVKAKYPGTNLKVLQVAKWMEYGTSRMPARPLFNRVYEYFRKSVSQYYKKFLNLKAKGLI